MAKKQETEVVEKPQVKEKIVKQSKKNLSTKLEESWEIKDRQYYLTRGLSPVSYQLKSSNIFYFDEEKGYERELKNTSNQRTPFVDEFPKDSDARLEHIVFRNGVLFVPKNKQTLQKLLSLYHPQKEIRYKEKEREQEAVDQLEMMEIEIAALNLAYEMEIDMAEAIMRIEVGSKVAKMSSKELKRDLVLIAKNKPVQFLQLAQDDNIFMRNMGIKATEEGIISLSPDNRIFTWSSSGRKLMNVPFDEHPYSALASWFKTDEGMEIYKQIEKRLG